MKFILYLYCGYLYCVNCKNAYHNIRLAYAIIIHYTRFLSREQQIFSYNEHKKLFRIMPVMRQISFFENELRITFIMRLKYEEKAPLYILVFRIVQRGFFEHFSLNWRAYSARCLHFLPLQI